MSIALQSGIATLSDEIEVTAAEELLSWLSTTAEPAVDLHGCTHLHASVLQLLMVARPRVTRWPEDALLRDWLQQSLPESSTVGVNADG